MLTYGAAPHPIVKESALALFKEVLEAEAFNWADDIAKSKKYASIGEELAESLSQYQRWAQMLQLMPTNDVNFWLTRVT